MKFYLAETFDSESTRIFSSFKDAKNYAISLQTNRHEENEPHPVTVYKMDVSINQNTILNLILKYPYWNEKTEVFQIGLEELIEQSRQRIEKDETKTGITFEIRRNDNE